MIINGSLTIHDDQHIDSESHPTTTANENKRQNKFTLYEHLAKRSLRSYQAG
jgi:hypothetical protein